MVKFVRGLLKVFGYTILNTRKYYSGDELFTLHTPRFLQDPLFKSAYGRGIQASHGVDPEFEWRVHAALWAAARALCVQGDFVECGVNAGFISSAILHRLGWETVDKTFYLIDTFSGPILSQYSKAEAELGRTQIAQRNIEAGAYVTDMSRVRANYAEWPRVKIIKGAIPDILSSLAIERIAFLHIDLNCAAPECAALELFWECMSPHGLILLDDYAYWGHSYQGDAIDTVAKRLGTGVLTLPTGQGLILK